MHRVARIALASIATTLSSTAALAQAPVELLLGPRSVLPGVPGEVDEVIYLDQGLLHGWVAVARTFHASSLTESIVGVTGTDPSAPPVVLRTPGTVGGVAQTWFRQPALGAQGEVAYISAASTSPESVWIDDTRIAGLGDPIGATGWVWEGFTDLDITDSGGLFIRGATRFGGAFREIVVRYPGETVVLVQGGSVAGGGSVVNQIVDFTASPSGDHWVSQVRLTDFARSLVADGAIVEIEPGFPVKAGRLLPASLGAPSGAVWTSPFWRSTINDRGQVAFAAGGQHSSGTERVTVRDGRSAIGFNPPLGNYHVHSLDLRGVAVFQASGDGFRTETELIQDAASGLDVDGDGVADPGWSVSFTSSTQGRASATGALVVNANVDGPGFGDHGSAVIRLHDAWFGTTQCTQPANSTGHPASVVATGSSAVAENDLTLHAVGLPTGTLGMFITSRLPGLVPGVGGGQGNLCLGGAIGRYSGAIFNAGVTGVGFLEVDLTALPQPNGTVTAQPGETWYFQAWFRDTVGGAATSNLTDSVAVQLD